MDDKDFEKEQHIKFQKAADEYYRVTYFEPAYKEYVKKCENAKDTLR